MLDTQRIGRAGEMIFVRILVAYIAVAGGQLTSDYAARFVSSYLHFPPGVDHQLLIVCNGGPLTRDQGLIFSPLKCLFYPRSNQGWDIGGYLEVSRKIPSDMLVCFGETIYFHRAEWLTRMADAFQQHGPGMYGSFSSNLVRPHINTTGFCIDPALLSSYPMPVDTRPQRYEFEHGNLSIWRRLAAIKKPVRLVTWDGEYEPHNWRVPSNILWKGDQSNCLAWCSHTDRYQAADLETKARWEKGANAPYRG